MPGPDPDDSQLRPEPRDAALSLCSLLKSPPGKLEGLRATGLHSQHATEGGIWLEGSPRGWGEAWLWNIPWEKATAPRPGAGGQLATGILCVAAAFMWVSWRGVHEREGTQKDGDREEGAKSMDSLNGGL